jgi:hypothetical protein
MIFRRSRSETGRKDHRFGLLDYDTFNRNKAHTVEVDDRVEVAKHPKQLISRQHSGIGNLVVIDLERLHKSKTLQWTDDFQQQQIAEKALFSLEELYICWEDEVASLGCKPYSNSFLFFSALMSFEETCRMSGDQANQRERTVDGTVSVHSPGSAVDGSALMNSSAQAQTHSLPAGIAASFDSSWSLYVLWDRKPPIRYLAHQSDRHQLARWWLQEG